MNIFDQYLDKIKKIILDLSKKGKIILPDNLDGINTEIPPEKFNCDISTNVAMVLSKINKKPPLELAETLAKSLENEDKSIKEVSIVKPGIINIKFQPEFWTNLSKEIINMIQKNIFKPEFNIFIFTVALKAVVLLLQGEWIDLLYYFFHLKVFQFH